LIAGRQKNLFPPIPGKKLALLAPNSATVSGNPWFSRPAALFQQAGSPWPAQAKKCMCIQVSTLTVQTGRAESPPRAPPVPCYASC